MKNFPLFAKCEVANVSVFPVNESAVDWKVVSVFPVNESEFDWKEACIEREEQHRLWSDYKNNTEMFTYKDGILAAADCVHFMKVRVASPRETVCLLCMLRKRKTQRKTLRLPFGLTRKPSLILRQMQTQTLFSCAVSLDTTFCVATCKTYQVV